MQNLAKEKKLSSLEKPKQFSISAELMSEQNNCITATFKTKRNVAAKLFQPQIDEMYEAITQIEAATTRQ